MVTSLIEMPESQNFVNVTTSTRRFESRDVMDENYDVITSISKYHYSNETFISKISWHLENRSQVY